MFCDFFQNNKPSLDNQASAQVSRYEQNALPFLQKEHPTACSVDGECNPPLEF